MKEVIRTEKAPLPLGSYSQAVKIGNFVFISGQIPINPKTGSIDTLDFKLQTNQVFENLLAIINEVKADCKNIIKINVYLTDLEKFSIFNDTMVEYIKPPFPARSIVGVSSLPKGSQIELEAIVYI